jgi:GT2 family glycosyltransferase/SAM-dependent methyltransferase
VSAELSIVLVNHDGAACLPGAIAALRDGTDTADVECIVVDSGSTDGSWRDVGRLWDRARALRFEQNIGFCAGCNRGTEAATGTYVAFVNFDGQVEPAWDVPLRAALADPGVSVAGGLLVRPDGATLEAAGLGIAPNMATFGLLEGRPRTAAGREPVDVAAVSGALMMVRRDEFLALGGFYEPIWMYGEEADYCLRAPGRVVLDPRGAIRHEHGHAAGPRRSATRLYWPSRNRLVNAARHLPPARLAGSVAASAAFDMLVLVETRRSEAATAIARGWLDGLRAAPRERRGRTSEERRRAATRLVPLRDAARRHVELGRARRPASIVGAASPHGCPACAAPLPATPALHGADRLHGTPGEFDVLVCDACGSGLTLPVVGEDELARFYPESYNAYSLPDQAHLRAAATLLFRWRYWRGLRRPPLAELTRRSGGRLLDVGGGRGDLGVVLRPRGWHVTSLDPSDSACAEARARGIDSIRGTLLRAGGELGQGYDAVVFQHSLEHVVDPVASLRAARGLLAEGGLVIVTLPNFGSWQSRRLGADWFHLDLPRHRAHFTPAGLESALRRAGFEAVSLSTSTSADGLPTSLQYRLLGGRPADPALRLLATAVSLAAAPLTAVLDRLAGAGDILHAVAIARST